LRASSLYLSVASLFIVSLFISLFILPIGYTYDEICPRCHGEGSVTCETCHGSGKCPFCDGTGRIWYMPESDNWCAACQGTGRCYTCGGSGSHACGECRGTGTLIHWMYTPIGSTIVLSISNVLLFLGLFLLGYVASAFYLSFNQWVYKVEDMGFWFNPSFMTWLFAKHPKRWIKWETGFNLIGAIYLGVLFFAVSSLKNITQESFVTGVIFSIAIFVLFSLIFYKTCISRLEASQ